MERTYDSIAPYFVKHRNRVWPPTSSLLEDISPCRIADIGCGTGRLIAEAVKKGCQATGVDISSGQLKTAGIYLKDMGLRSGYDLIKGDMENLPIEDLTFDAVFLIASLHHLAGKDSRKKALREACRILKNEGIVQISVWSWDQDRFRDRHLERIEKQRDPDEFDGPLPGDFMVPWKDGAHEMRFYHLYGPGELEDDLKNTGLHTIRSFFDGRNHWMEAGRKSIE
jgi:SAM-dependent methyltransferase